MQGAPIYSSVKSYQEHMVTQQQKKPLKLGTHEQTTHTAMMESEGKNMISNFDYEKIEDIANLAIDDLYSIKEAANEHDLHSESLKENLEEVQECIDFMKLFTESEGKP